MIRPDRRLVHALSVAGAFGDFFDDDHHLGLNSFSHTCKELRSLCQDKAWLVVTVCGNRCLQGVTLPNNIRTLKFVNFNQGLQGVILPNSLQALIFGNRFNQSLQGVILPYSLQTLTFGPLYNRSLQGMTLPNMPYFCLY